MRTPTRQAWWEKRYAERKAAVDHAKRHGCEVCGEMDTRCLDLHHVDPENKSFTVSLSNYSVSEKRWLAEIEKCIVLCANCHRKLHHA